MSQPSTSPYGIPTQPALDIREPHERPHIVSLPASIFRPIHYLGSKLRLAPAIAYALDGVDPTRGTVLDLFAGSGTTALALATQRQVIASDIQEYSRVICNALLTTSPSVSGSVLAFESKLLAGTTMTQIMRYVLEPLVDIERTALDIAAQGDPGPICAIIEHGSILAAELGLEVCPDPRLRQSLTETLNRLKAANLTKSPLMTAVRYFGGTYFAYSQALELDCLAFIADAVSPPEVKDLFTAAILSTASDAVNTVGKQFAQPIRPRSKNGSVKRHLLAKIYRDRRVDVQAAFSSWLSKYADHARPTGHHRAVRGDYREVLRKFAGEYSVIYADPPYTRDHYSRFYHVLETLALRDNPTIARSPGASTGRLSRGLYRESRHQSPFCIRSQASGAFSDLFNLASKAGANLIVSYSPFDSGAHPRMMQIEALRDLAHAFYSKIEIENVGEIAHSKLNHSRLHLEASEQAEILLICQRPK